MKQSQRGFTIIELIVVTVVIGIMAGIMVTFFSPALSNYFATSRRAALSDVADGAMRRIQRDVRVSVSNSLRQWNNQWIEMVPTSAGGRYRVQPDTTWDAANPANPSIWMDAGQSYGAFDTVTPALAAANDWVVIGNQEANDVYAAANRQSINNVVDYPAGVPGRSRITLNGTISVPAGYDGTRYVIVPGGQGPVSYVCQGLGTNSAGNGTGALMRHTGYQFSVGTPTLSPTPAIVANHVSACTFSYIQNPGATQESGYLEVDITVTEANESVRLRFGVHVDNVP